MFNIGCTPSWREEWDGCLKNKGMGKKDTAGTL